MFLRASIRESGIPFDLKMNVVTLLGRMIAKDKNVIAYDNISDLRKALEV